jgi:hypothetical protein
VFDALRASIKTIKSWRKEIDMKPAVEDEDDDGFPPTVIEPFEAMSPEVRAWMQQDLHLEQPSTEAQKAFWKMMTVQRIANVVASADFYQNLSPEAKRWLLKADKQKISQLNSTVDFMNASKIIWKFLWVGGAMVGGAFIGVSQFWKALKEFIVVQIK